MYGQHPLADTRRIVHAMLTDQVAHFAPRLYIKLTGQTGRGASQESAQQIADYFRHCFDEYFQVLGIEPGQICSYLAGKRILEYGPGDVPGVALLMIAHGASSVVCVDRFPMVSISGLNAEVLGHLMEGLDGEAKARAASCFLKQGDPASGLCEQRIRYLVKPGGLSGLSNAADLIVSRAVLEHVNDLHATFADMRSALCETGVAIHQVDLKSHGLHRSNPLDFLTWPEHWWSWMYGHKGMPNRWRVNRYREALQENSLRTLLLKPTALAEQRDIEDVRPYLAEPFRAVSDSDLSWLGFWLVCDKTTQAQGE
ncbi:MAG: methyltransferase type 12 [Nitrosomonadales bacterium]|nr:MAG: methyltransferase type 12 [Nitrosomonadales bacterium]